MTNNLEAGSLASGLRPFSQLSLSHSCTQEHPLFFLVSEVVPARSMPSRSISVNIGINRLDLVCRSRFWGKNQRSQKVLESNRSQKSKKTLTQKEERAKRPTRFMRRHHRRPFRRAGQGSRGAGLPAHHRPVRVSPSVAPNLRRECGRFEQRNILESR